MNLRAKLPPVETTMILLTAIYIVGVVGLLNTATLSIFIFLTPINIFLAFSVAFIYDEKINTKLIIVSTIIYLGGFLIEGLGVYTQKIFGPYVYGTALGLKVWNVPIIMGANWLLLVYGSLSIAQQTNWNKYQQWLLASSIMVVYDIFLERSAIKYVYWIWENDIIPIQNYIAWFVFAFLFIAFFDIMIKRKINNRVAEFIVILQFLFFVILYLLEF